MKKALLISVKFAYVNQTGETVELNENEKFLNAIAADEDRKYFYVEISTPICWVCAKTKKDIEEKIWAAAKENDLGYDFQVYFKK